MRNIDKKNPVIHKVGPKKMEVYAGFGHYNMISTPLCAGPRGVYKGNNYWVHRNWKNVTCKHCLKIKSKSEEIK
jgi:hypothetical protein